MAETNLIYRRAAIDAIDKERKENHLFNTAEDGLLYARGIVNTLPPVDAVPVRRGKWKAVTEDGEEYKRICSYCGKEAPFDETERVYLIYPHCPWCGARMEDGDG